MYSSRLDINRLSLIPLLKESGWRPENKIDLEHLYAKLEKQYQNSQSICDVLQVPLKEVFPAAKEIIEGFNGVCIKNLHPELGLGADCNTIEFDFFEYDRSNFLDLQILNYKAQERLLFIGIGYDIIGDWLIAESGRIYFFNKISDRLHLVSENIYEFFEQDIYKLQDINGISIFDHV